MSSTQSSDDNLSDEEMEHTQRTRVGSTPRTPLSPHNAFPKDSFEPSKRPRNNSFVRFQGLKTPFEDEVQSSSVTTLKDTSFPPSHEEEGNGVKSTSQFHAELLDRVTYLEDRFHNLELSRHPGSSEKGDESSERTGLSTEIQWLTWQDYLEDASKASNILEVLIEKPHTNLRRKLSVSQPMHEAHQKSSLKSPPGIRKNIERIRIRSPHIINALQLLTEQTFSSSSRLIIHRPFKVLLFYHEQISDYLSELEHAFSQSTHCHLGERCKGLIHFDEGISNPQNNYQAGRNSIWRESFEKSRHMTPNDIYAEGMEDDECKHEVSEELLAQLEAITHLRILTKFMKEDMQEVFAKHELLRSSDAETIAFQDVWHLFMAGDFVVTEDETSGKAPELYQVSILPACDFFSSRRPVKQIQTRTEGSHQLVESVYKAESVSAMSVFTVDLFYFDFDGQKFGPVEQRMEMVSYEGEKKITDLPLYPLRFRKDSAQLKAKMLKRGEKFHGLSNIADYPHREYNGLSVVEPQEQVSLPIKHIGSGHQANHWNLSRSTAKSSLTSIWRIGSTLRMPQSLGSDLGSKTTQELLYVFFFKCFISILKEQH